MCCVVWCWFVPFLLILSVYVPKVFLLCEFCAFDAERAASLQVLVGGCDREERESLGMPSVNCGPAIQLCLIKTY